jgi:hypothetical protein
MTSTYDNLGSLFYEAEDNLYIRNLVEVIYDYTIAEINQVNPSILHWSTWKGKKLYGEGFGGKAEFLSDVHSLLDHVEKYHLRTINGRLDIIVSRVADWFVRYKDRKGFYVRFFRFDDFDKSTRDRYPKVFQILKQMVKEGFIQIPEDKYFNKMRKKIEKW